ncbi:MAG: protein translocase subunit SecF [Actinomycetota bacterium]|nr:protein translocase subunit SecF [Actinomycetota bacterium]
MSTDDGTREVEGSEKEVGDLGDAGDRARGEAGRDQGLGGDGVGEEEPAAEAVSEDELVEEEVERLAARAPATPPRGPRRVGPFRRLYRGETSFDFVRRRRWWFAISSVVILAGVASLGIRGLNLGITFKGGEAWSVKAPGITQSQAMSAVQAAGLSQPTVEILGSGSHQTVRVTADLNGLGAAAQRAETTRVISALAKLTRQPKTAVSVTTVGPTWGGQVTQKAVIALIVFLVLVAVYISLRFEPKMALAAFIALLHDLLVTAGVYSLAGFQVTPDTVIAVLTILGYSLYDTVVVFDRVRDNSKGLGATGRMTYSEMVNLSMNQTLARSINTSLVAILPVLSVLLVGAQLLGATTLQDYGLALFVGLCSGAYSSIFIASPILAWLKEREPRYVAMRQRIEAKGERLGLLTPKAAATLLAAGTGGGAIRASRDARASTIRPGQGRRDRLATAQASTAATATLEPGVRASAGDGVAAPAGNGASFSAGSGAAVRPGNGAGAPRAGARPQRQSPARRQAPRSRKAGKGKRRR